MTLRKLMELSSDDTWFCVQEPGFSGRVLSFYNADFVVEDVDVMKKLRPFIGRKIGRIRIVARKDPMSPRRKCNMIEVTLEGK